MWGHVTRSNFESIVWGYDWFDNIVWGHGDGVAWGQLSTLTQGSH